MFGAWRRRTRADAQPRWVVVDVETTGMDMKSDELISIGAVALSEGCVVPADSFEITVRQARPSAHQNILVHGVGAQAQLAGSDPGAALCAFIEFVGPAPLVAFHAPFDRGFLMRAIKAHADRRFDNPWLDLAELAPVLDVEARIKSLDEWLQRYQIQVSTRHNAAADALATALLAVRLLPLAKRQGATDFSSLQRLARAARWLS